MKKLVSLLLAMGMMLVTLQGCNTLQGAGQDIEEGGEAVQDAAD